MNQIQLVGSAKGLPESIVSEKCDRHSFYYNCYYCQGVYQLIFRYKKPYPLMLPCVTPVSTDKARQSKLVLFQLLGCDFDSEEREAISLIGGCSVYLGQEGHLVQYVRDPVKD